MKPDIRRMIQDVRRFTAMPREYGNVRGLDQTAEALLAAWEKMGLPVAVQTFQVEGKTYRNVIAYYGPKNAERIVIGAHYDVVEGSPGADDNASGLAALLELSRLLQQHRPTLRKRIDLVAYTLEETGLQGSEHHAEMLVQQGVKVKGMISLEMIGYYSDQPGSQQIPHPALAEMVPDTGNFLALVGTPEWMKLVAKHFSGNSTLPVYAVPVSPMLPDSYRSDHASFIRRDMPALMMTDTANFRNPNYHKQSDTPGTLDYKRMAEAVKGLYGVVVELGR